MPNALTQNGVSTTTTTAPGTERHEIYKSQFRPGKTLIQYDYRHTDGSLFACVARTLETARSKRDAWLDKKQNGEN